MSSGTFVSFEGTEGSGKSTQMVRLKAQLEAEGRDVLLIREPGGTELGEEIRDLLLAHRGTVVDSWAELCLYAAARAQLVASKIRPALSTGAVVLADRFADSSVAYQGGGRELGPDRVTMLNSWVTGGLRPDRVFLFDLDPRVGLERAGKRGAALDRLEAEPLPFHERVRRAYLELAQNDPERVVVLDATNAPDQIEERIREEMTALLG